MRNTKSEIPMSILFRILITRAVFSLYTSIEMHADKRRWKILCRETFSRGTWSRNNGAFFDTRRFSRRPRTPCTCEQWHTSLTRVKRGLALSGSPRSASQPSGKCLNVSCSLANRLRNCTASSPGPCRLVNSATAEVKKTITAEQYKC